MKKKKGFLLVGVLFVFLFLMIIVPVMVKWIQNDTKISVKDQKSSFAFSLAEAAVDRGYWKVKSSTITFASVMDGHTLPGYNFDSKYTDISGGNYRVSVTSGPGAGQVTIVGEGRDWQNKETRAIKAIFTNTSVSGAIIAGGLLSATGASVVHWGPIMAMGDITVSGSAATNGFPRKLARQTVKPFDPTGDTNPPNTDSLEWWSNYNVPELPVFDFTAMRSSAAQTGTLNCDDVTITSTTYGTETVYRGSGCSDPGSHCSCADNKWAGSGCTDSGSNCSCSGSGSSKVCSGSGCTGPSGVNCVNTPKTCSGSGCSDSGANCDAVILVTTNTANVTGMNCCSSVYYGGPVTCSYGGTGCTDCKLQNLYDNAALRDKDYTWYWDKNVDWSGKNGLRGTIIVRGNLGITGGDYYCKDCVLPVPPSAWQEYQKIDTSDTDEYPGDLGLKSNASTYQMGSCGVTCEGGPLGADLGVYGFLYVGGDFNRAGDSDVFGAMWVVGDVSGAGNTMLFYNSNLQLPTLNVVLIKDSWLEQKPSTVVWP
ncbi:MAG: hypothetical protein PHV36_09120 [Elusimicrobiales bacterium]|nr:hypothetical protein [Elusimicrobiales bacterium]